MTAGVVGLVVALAVGDPAPALIAVPMLVLGVVGLAGGVSPQLELTVESAPESMVEHGEATVEVTVAVDAPVGRTYVDLGLDGLSIESVHGGKRIGTSTVLISSIDDLARLDVTLSASAWGRGRIGPATVYMESPLGLFDLRYRSPVTKRVVVVPEEQALKTLLEPLETNLHVGDLVSSHRGPGSEFADLRAYQLGDDPRMLNWRVSSRAQSLWVNERHPERNGDLLLLVDAQVESGTGLEVLVDRSVRMAAALLHSHARRHHRLGLITLDGMCRWVYPGMGEAHRRRLIEQLMSVEPGEVLWEAAERALTRAARRPSMVLALTPLMDLHLAGMIHAVRRSGVDISVVELDMRDLLPPPGGEARSLGRRIWALERDRLRDLLLTEGIPVTLWRSIDPPDVPLRHLAQWRTSWRQRLG